VRRCEGQAIAPDLTERTFFAVVEKPQETSVIGIALRENFAEPRLATLDFFPGRIQSRVAQAVNASR